MKKLLSLWSAALFLVVFIVGCNVLPEVAPEAGSAEIDEETSIEPGKGMRNSMMERHHAPIPEEYAGLTNPIKADEESLSRGEEQFATLCASCHGDGGLGDGPAGTNLDIVPANIAHTSQMMGDAYLFWRISEGGLQFGSVMPAWGESLDEQVRWDLINYIRALGSGEITPLQNVGGASFDPEEQAAREAEMLAQAVDQGVITQDEADIFSEAHEIVDARMAELRGTGIDETMDEMLVMVLDELVAAGELTQEQAEIFLSVHDRLGEAGLMQ